MFGYFGNFLGNFGSKGAYTPPPGAPPPSETTETETEEDAFPGGKPMPGRPKLGPWEITSKSRASSSDDVVKSRLSQLRAAIAARRAEKTAKLRALRARQAKQAAYGRGETSTGKRSESEIAIGVSSGYYSGLGSLDAEIDAAGAEVVKATSLVKALTKDLKAGGATSTELQQAMASLAEKAKIAKELSEKVSSLKGYGEEAMSPWPIASVVVLGALAWWLLR